jgi:hypothetical protein
VEYPPPADLRSGPASPVFTVKFAADPASAASGVFDMRLLKQLAPTAEHPVLLVDASQRVKMHYPNGCLVLCLLLLLRFASTAQPRNPFGHALIPDLVADASIVELNGTFYCYATTDGYDQGLKTSGPPVVWQSQDFVRWSFSGSYFPSAVGQLYWAPSKAVPVAGRYFIYPTVNGFMYPAVAASPTGPFKLATGPDVFTKPFSAATLLKAAGNKEPAGIDAEIFVDDDRQAYVFWQHRQAARLLPSMTGIDTASRITVATPRGGYSEGPIFFKRKGIYYYLYTLGGDEKYQYAYVMSKVSPLGPFEFPQQDLVATTAAERGIYGPGHGCVFTPTGTDDYYFAYLEFGRRGTNRQTYVNKLQFNNDGTIKPVELTLDGVGALRPGRGPQQKTVRASSASSTRPELVIQPIKDPLFKRTESFGSAFAFDAANGSRWMAADADTACWLVADLGKSQLLQQSELYFVRPTETHTYSLQYSNDGKHWLACGAKTHPTMQAPQTDALRVRARYLRVQLHQGVKGIWEWNIY